MLRRALREPAQRVTAPRDLDPPLGGRYAFLRSFSWDSRGYASLEVHRNGRRRVGGHRGVGRVRRCSRPVAAYDLGPSTSARRWRARTGRLSVEAFAISRLYLGEFDRNGLVSPNAWMDYGYDIDGKASTPSSTDVCVPQPCGAGNFVHTEGHDGIDNSFGHFILPILEVAYSNVDAKANDAILSGSLAFLIIVTGLGAGRDYSSMTGFAVSAAPTTQPLAWDGTDTWSVDRQSVVGTDVSTASLRGPAYMSGRVFVATLGGTGGLPVANLRGARLSLAATHVTISMKVSDDGLSATEGVISAVLLPDALVEVGKQIVGSFNPLFCNYGAFENLANEIRGASDILLDGTQDSSQTCNGISAGIGFDAVRVQLGPVVEVPSGPSPCCTISADGGVRDASSDAACE